MRRLLLTVLGIFSAVSLSTAHAAGSLTPNLRIYSRELGYELNIRIYQPDSSNVITSGVTFPVLYVLDGEWFLNEGGMQEILDSEIAEKRVSPLLVVFVDSRDPDRPDHSRRNKEFMCNGKYASFFRNELLPTIEARYPVTKNQVSRAITGVSFGGLSTACFGQMIPDAFAGFGLLSPASAQHLAIVAKLYKKDDGVPRHFFLSGGTKNDNLSAIRDFQSLLESKHYPVTMKVVPFSHGWDNWKPLLPAMLESLFPPKQD